MIKLLKGNCLDLLRQLEPGCADLVLIDPPYSSGGLFAGDRKQDTRVKYTDADFNGVNTKQKHHQTEKPVELLKALIQICPRGGPWWTASWDPAARASLASRRAGASSASSWATNTSTRPPSASRRPRTSC